MIVHGRRSQATAEAVAEEAAATGVRSQVLLADLREAETCRGLVRQAWEIWDGLDVWVNNAGADTLTGEAALAVEAQLAELLAVDVTATMLVAQDVAHG